MTCDNSILVVIVVFGQQSTANIVRCLNMIDVAFKLVLPEELPKYPYSHIILSSSSRNDENNIPSWVVYSQAPVLGIGYGMELIATYFGATLESLKCKEMGLKYITEISGGRQSQQPRWIHRHSRVTNIPSSFSVVGVMDGKDMNSGDVISFTDYKKWWAVQYHPEAPNHVDTAIFKRFLNIK